MRLARNMPIEIESNKILIKISFSSSLLLYKRLNTKRLQAMKEQNPWAVIMIGVFRLS